MQSATQHTSSVMKNPLSPSFRARRGGRGICFSQGGWRGLPLAARSMFRVARPLGFKGRGGFSTYAPNARREVTIAPLRPGGSARTLSRIQKQIATLPSEDCAKDGPPRRLEPFM
jgi:hypothetical protein